jgi:hypothetical protein
LDFGLLACYDSCPFALNGVCEDGGFGSQTSACAKGTDCSDCGERSFLDVKNTTQQGSVIVNPAEYARCTSQEDTLQDFVLSARTIAQKAYDLGASMLIIYGRDDVAKPSWSHSRTLVRRNDIPIPVLLISNKDGSALLSLMSNSTAPVDIQLSKEPYCDSMYRYGM